jgi:predicted RNA methylase
LAPLNGKHVLEIGCGAGHLTRGYLEKAAFVTAIDPDPEKIASAKQKTPQHLWERVEFIASSIEGFCHPPQDPDLRRPYAVGRFDESILRVWFMPWRKRDGSWSAADL